MQSERFKEGIKRVYARYDKMMEKQGFYVVLGICVLVIALSAFYTFRLREEAVTDPPPEEIENASAINAQTLADAQALISSQSEPLKTPEETAFRFTQPLNGITGRTFSDTEPQFFEQSNSWQLHTGIDLLADYGTLVAACAPGTVKRAWRDNELGLCVLIDHQNGYESLYAGLSDASYVRAGDAVARGQTIGHAGNGVLAESDAEPHLHLEVRKDGRAIDPLYLFLGVDK